MLGAIVGDVAGSRFEFHNHRSKDFDLFAEESTVTDDSIMTLAVAKAIMETEKKMGPGAAVSGITPGFYPLLEAMTIKYMREIGRRYPECGYGGMFFRWLFSDDPQPYNSFGNGAAMRVSPVGFVAASEAEAIRLSRAVTVVTHNHAEGIKGAEATATAIYLARCGSSKDVIREKIRDGYYDLDFTIDGIRDGYRFNATCQETVPQAIQAFLESISFEDAIRTAISLGGDSDTLAAITGSIAEAYYGVPQDIRDKALGYLDGYLRTIYEEWQLFLENRGRSSPR